MYLEFGMAYFVYGRVHFVFGTVYYEFGIKDCALCILIVKLNWVFRLVYLIFVHNSWINGPLEERKIFSESSERGEPFVNNK